MTPGLLRLKSDVFFHFSSLTLIYRNRIQASPEMAFCIVCARLSWPDRWRTLAKTFGRSSSTLSLIFTDTILYLSQRYKQIIRWHPTVNRARIKRYARVLRKHGGGGHVWGFIDGTFLGVCRPTQEQRKLWSGYKKKHGIKYQGIVTPDGLITSMARPYLGEMNDNRMVAVTALHNHLRDVCIFISLQFV